MGNLEKDKPFDYFMLKDELNSCTVTRKNLGNLALASLSSCCTAMGLFGLASFMAEKEN